MSQWRNSIILLYLVGIWTMHNEMFSAVNGDRTDAPNIGVVITDGASSVDADRTIPEAQAAKEKGVELFAIGVGDEVSNSMHWTPQLNSQDYVSHLNPIL